MCKSSSSSDRVILFDGIYDQLHVSRGADDDDGCRLLGYSPQQLLRLASPAASTAASAAADDDSVGELLANSVCR